MLEQCGLNRAGWQREGRRPGRVGPAARIIFERPKPAEQLGVGIVRIQVCAVEWPSRVADSGTDLEIDRVQRTGGPTLVTWTASMPVRPTERPNPRLVRQMDRIAHTLAAIQSLDTAFHIPAAALQQPYAGTVTDQLAGDTDPCRPLPRRCRHRHRSAGRCRPPSHPTAPASPSISIVLAQAYDATMMPIPAPRDNFQQCKLRPRKDGVRLWGRIAQGPGSGGGIEQATAESEQRR
jgi:hypothetical protein